MKNVIIIIFVLLSGCTSRNIVRHNNQLSKKILHKQYQNKTFAISAYWGRKQIFSKLSKFNINKTDTLFLIERIVEPSLELWCNIWTSKRDVVLEYEDLSGIMKDTTYNYRTWQNSFKTNVERFDTVTIDKHKILGGYRTFMTQVINGKVVKTFFFDDFKSSFSNSIFKK